jgi:Fur family transcriptional regulator, zinc uptake regulator
MNTTKSAQSPPSHGRGCNHDGACAHEIGQEIGQEIGLEMGLEHAGQAGKVHINTPLTPARQRVLDVLLAAHKPMGAYEMIDQLAKITGKSPAPISIYRALDHLVELGLVHRLASRNAYLACGHGHSGREPVAFLICDRCGGVTEVMSDALGHSLDGLAALKTFRTRHSVIELAGICAPCQSTDQRI